MVRGLISERSYPWAVEPAGLNGSIRHRLSGEGSGGEWNAVLGGGRAGATPEILDQTIDNTLYKHYT